MMLTFNCSGVDAVENMEENTEVVSEQKQDIPEEVTGTDVAVEVQKNEELCDNTEFPADENMALPVIVNDEVQISEGMLHQIVAL